MKKLFFVAVALVASASVFTSCKKECTCTIEVMGMKEEMNADDTKKLMDETGKSCDDLNSTPFWTCKE